MNRAKGQTAPKKELTTKHESRYSLVYREPCFGSIFLNVQPGLFLFVFVLFNNNFTEKM